MERHPTKTRTLRRGHVYGVKNVETIAVVESTIRGVKVAYTGTFCVDAPSVVDSEKTKTE